MAIVNFSGFELGEDGTSPKMEGYSYTAGGGLAQVVTTPVKTGTYAFEFSQNGSNSATPNCAFSTKIETDGRNVGNNISLTAVYFQFNFRPHVAPASVSEEFASIETTGVGNVFAVRIDSTRKLSLWGETLTHQLGSTGSTVLSLDTWYQIGMHVNPSTGAYDLYINGVLELSGTFAFTNATVSGCHLGMVANRNGNTTMDLFFDDVIVDDASYHDLAVVKVIIPTANGSTMSFTNGTNASDYTQVGTIPPQGTTYIMSPTTGNPNVGLMAMQDTGTVSISGVILALKGLILSRENSTVTSAHLIRIKSGSSTSDSNTFNGSTSVVPQVRLLETDPATGSAWSLSAIDAVEIGIVENNAVAVRCEEIFGMVLYYIPPVVAPTVTTSSADTIATTSANGNGNVTSDGGGTITERGFVLSTSSNPTTSDTKFTESGTTGAYSGSMTGLSNNTLYHYRAYAINSAGTSYGADTTFTTKVASTLTCTVQTYAVTFIDASFHIAVKLLATVQTYTVTFVSAVLRYGKSMICTVQTYVVTFNDALFHKAVKLTATVQTYTVTFVDAILNKAVKMFPTVQTYTVTFIDASFHKAVKLIATVQTYTVTFIDAGLHLGRHISADVQTYTVTFVDALFHKALKLKATVQTYVVSFKAIRFLVNGFFTKYTNATKHTATFANDAKSSALWTNETKNI